jgi:PAS domain S-box-containing protein
MSRTEGFDSQNQSARRNNSVPEALPDLKAMSHGELLKYTEELQEENRRLSREKDEHQNKPDGVDSSSGTGEHQKLKKYMGLILENMPNVFLLLDRDSRIVYCTGMFLKYLNIDNFECIDGQPIAEVSRKFQSEDFARDRIAHFERVKSTGQKVETEILIDVPAMNGPRSFLVRSIPLTGENSEFDGLLSIFYDITSVKNAEEARTKLILDTTPLASSLWSLDNTLIDCNDEALRLFRLSSREDFQNYFKNMPKYQVDGTPSRDLTYSMAVAAYKNGSKTFEWMYQTENGKPIYLETVIVRIPWKDTSCMVTYTRDLTAIKANERLAQEAEDYNRLMLDGVPQACVLFDEDFKILTCNSEALDLYGFEDETEYAENFFKFSPEFQPDGRRSDEVREDRFNEVVRAGFVVFEWLHHRTDGSDLPMEITLVKMPWKDGYRIASYGRDLRAEKAQQELTRKAEERTLVMLNAMPMACLLMDTAGNFHDCNSAAVTLFGMKSREDGLEHFYDYYMPEFQPNGIHSKTESVNRIKAAVTVVDSLKFEWIHCNAESKNFPTEVTLVRVDWQNRWHIAVYIQDITEIKENAERIHQANERTRVMLDATPMACVFLDKQGSAIDCNAEAPRLFGVSSKQEFLERYYELMPESQPGGLNSLTETHRQIERALETGYGCLQWLYTTTSGEELPAEVIMIRVEWNSIFCIATYIRDLRTLHEKEREVQKAERIVLLKEQHLEIVADISKFAYWEMSGDNLALSSHFEKHFGYRPDEIRSVGFVDRVVRHPPSRWIDILHPEDLERTLREMDDYFTGVAKHYRSEVRVRHKITGEYLWAISAGIGTEWQDGKPVVIVGGLFNIDDIKRTESAANAKTQFLASMSHEIRTPMNAIIGMSDLMRTDNLDERQKEFFSDIKKMSKALLQIINDILDFSKIEAGKLDLLPINFNLSELLNNIVSMHRFTAQSKGLDFKFSIDADVPAVVYGDDIRIRQIVTNLLSNAVKYTKEGTVSFRVNRTRENGVNYIVFSIEDTGIGIRKEDITRMFDSFEQLDGRLNRGISGTGLGLSITKKLTEMMNGRIDIKSEYGKGSVFTVLLPLQEGDPLSAEDMETAVRVTAKDGVNILVVDDNLINIKVAVAYLAAHNIKADTAESGLEAIKKAKQKMYHLVFMDHMMSGMDGIEATRRIRALGGWYKAAPIIALTANAVSGMKELFFKNEMNDFLSKPIDANEFNRMLAKWLPSDMIIKSTEKISERGGSGAADEQDLIDKATGMLYAAGDEALYGELLRDFASTHRQDIQKLQTAMDTGNLKAARLIAHTLKSSSALIGAKQLSAAALVAETHLSGGRILSDKDMDKLKTEFGYVTIRLGEMLAEQPLEGSGGAPRADEDPQAENAPDRTRILALTEKLMPLLKSSSTAAFDLKDDIRKVLASEGEDCKKLLELIDDFGFEEAAMVLEKIMEKLKKEDS